MWFAAVLVCAALTAETGATDVRPDVYSLHVVSHVRSRFARTVVTSRVANPSSAAQEIAFDAVLPEAAFISGFVIEMDGQSYSAYVRGKEEAKREYQSAVSRGRGAAHVHLSARDSNVVSVSVNVEPQKKVTFNLTYEELLNRELGAYNLRINLNPGQLVNDLSVEVHINETSPITRLEVPSLQESNEIADLQDNSSNPLAHVERPAPTVATVRWAPTREQQQQLREEGVKGQLVVSYDVDHSANPNQILLSDDGYFVHFYSPSELSPLPKHVVFVLDTSGSMSGRKISQLKTAMHTILDELNEGDTFSLVPFASSVQVWHPGVPLDYDFDFNYYTVRHPVPSFNESAIVPATRENIDLAKQSVSSFQANGATYMFAALSTGLRVCEAGRSSGGRRATLLVLLTDGEPNGDVSDPDEIVRRVTHTNEEFRAAIFTLAFGTGADFGFLRRLALRNGGFARRIYEAADSYLQLRNFYRQIASPLLSDVNFTYAEGQVEEPTVTQAEFPTLFRGGELVVAGRLAPGVEALGATVQGAGLIEGSLNASSASLERVSSAERLWAFLTVRQLLDRNAASPNDTVKDAAKQLALRYSFVTPVTSLVVVKPNATSSVDPAEAQPVSDDMDGVMPLSLSAPGYSNFLHSGPVLRSGLPGLPRPVAAFVPLSVVGSPEAIDIRTVHGDEDAQESTMAPKIATTEGAEAERLVMLSEVTWLEGVRNGSLVSLNVSGVVRTFQLATNQTDGEFGACSTPRGEPGACRHLARCPLHSFADSLSRFLDGYFCEAADAGASYLGTCCPDGLPMTITG